MVRIIKEATAKSFHATLISPLRGHAGDWPVACNVAKPLKALRFKTPQAAIEERWNSKPAIFNIKPHHHRLRLFGQNPFQFGRGVGTA
jgi:putative transposase